MRSTKNADLIGHIKYQVSVVATTRWLQLNQTLPLSAKGVACETSRLSCFMLLCMQDQLKESEFLQGDLFALSVSSVIVSATSGKMLGWRPRNKKPEILVL